MSEDVAFHSQYERQAQFLSENHTMLPARYVFVLTNSCNLNCSFCCQVKFRPDDYMTTGDWLELVKQIPGDARITLTGGEPFLFAGFAEVFSLIAERDNPCNVISNGILLNDETIELLLSAPNFNVLSISVDDIGNVVRNLDVCQWSTLVSNIEKFTTLRGQSGHKCLLDIKTIILDDNADKLFDIYRYCVEELRCDSHVFQFLKGSSIQHSDRAYPIEEIFHSGKPPVYKYWRVIMEQLELVREYNVKNRCYSYLHPKVLDLNSENSLADISFLNEVEFDRSLFERCKFIYSSAHVNCDGTVFPCLSVGVGNVKEKSLTDIINGRSMQKFRSAITEKGLVNACHRCGWLRLAD